MSILGFIGTGNMGGALARAAAKNTENRLLLANRHPEKAEALAARTGGECVGNLQAAREADFLFLGVKPDMFPEMLEGVRDALAGRAVPAVLVSMGAGIKIESIRRTLGFDCPVIRIMPNTPAAVGEGMILYACSEKVAPEKEKEFLDAMRFAGRFVKLEERLIDAGSAVSGCGPAFAALFIEALADGGVACGLPRGIAIECAAQTVVGTGRLLQATGVHPGEVKDGVCSPGGTTIQGVRALEEAGFRGAVMDAVIAAYEKTLNL